MNEEIKFDLETIARDLEGTITYLTTLDHSGRQSKKIVIEYDITQKGKDDT